MAVISRQYEPNNVEWRRVLDDSDPELRIDFCYSLLGFHLESGRLDMLLRFANGGHCRRHRHIASTVTLVLEGEQCLAETQPNGSTKLIVRKKALLNFLVPLMNKMEFFQVYKVLHLQQVHLKKHP